MLTLFGSLFNGTIEAFWGKHYTIMQKMAARNFLLRCIAFYNPIDDYAKDGSKALFTEMHCIL